MQKLLFIGGSGFVGKRLVTQLTGKAEILNVDPAAGSQVVGSVTDPDSFKHLMKGRNTVVLLGAEHRDDISPTSLYYDVNVRGMENVLSAMDSYGVRRIVFTSSVAIYGMNRVKPPSEEDHAQPFNHYGKSKWEAEQILMEWVKKGDGRAALVVRPTVIFGEANRGNVYNLLNQIQSGSFLMIGDGENHKSLAYVGNIVAFIDHMLSKGFSGYDVYNYVDKPDLRMKDLVGQVFAHKGKTPSLIRIPYFIGILVGYGFDLLAKLTGKKLPVSSIRIRKFCSNTVFDSLKLESTGFKRPYSLEEGLTRMLESEFPQ